MKQEIEHTGTSTPDAKPPAASNPVATAYHVIPNANAHAPTDDASGWFVGLAGLGYGDDRQRIVTQGRLSGISRLFKTTQRKLTNLVGKYAELKNEYATAKKEITSLRAQLEQAQKLACIDALTGIPNRRGAEAALDREFRTVLRHNTDSGSRKPQSISVIFFDADHFKQVNDTYGHDAGDAVLKKIAQLACSVFPRSDTTVARWGGEEFIVVLPCDSAHAGEKAEELRSTIERLCTIPKTDGKAVTVSIGTASYIPEPSDKHDTASITDRLVKQADDAAYKAKEGGRNRVIQASEKRNSRPSTSPQHFTLQ